MNLTQLQCGEAAEVEKVECDRELAERLSSLNIRPKARIKLIKVSMFRKTYLLQTGGSSVALGREVAKCIQINARRSS